MKNIISQSIYILPYMDPGKYRAEIFVSRVLHGILENIFGSSKGNAWFFYR